MCVCVCVCVCVDVVVLMWECALAEMEGVSNGGLAKSGRHLVGRMGVVTYVFLYG